ncbi:MAG TPA: YdeI/OmpD-associated family protein, partial [Edaphobacter sp.]|nr:YdeI/OmpD-associated family protein [Edaphobacter sp.]
MGHVLGADDPVLACDLHLAPAETEEARSRMAAVKLGDDLGPVVIARGLTGGEKDGRVGGRRDAFSVDFSGGACMAGQVKRFRAVLEPLPGGLGWVVARVPFDVSKAWKKMVRLRVKVETGDEIFRTSLFADSTHGGHFVLVNKKMQKAAGVQLGGMIDLAVEPDLDERETEAPSELEKLFKKEKALAKWYAKLSDSIRRDIARTITDVKNPETRARRVEQMAERMLLAMEGEKTLPPILDVAFRKRPAARAGWEKMTEVQRRGHLLGVFYYQSPEAREKRAGKVVEDCLRVAEAK